MTREEAISIMNVIVHMLEPQYDTDRVENAVEIAIKALQQEPCENALDLYECPCGYGWDKNKVVRHHFCPNCGRAVNGSIKAEQEPCEDAISREKALQIIRAWFDRDATPSDLKNEIEQLPPVTPQPKMGRWIDIMVGDMPAQACDQCNVFYPLAYTGGGHKYCPNCGAKMSEVEE